MSWRRARRLAQVIGHAAVTSVPASSPSSARSRSDALRPSTIRTSHPRARGHEGRAQLRPHPGRRGPVVEHALRGGGIEVLEHAAVELDAGDVGAEEEQAAAGGGDRTGGLVGVDVEQIALDQADRCDDRQDTGAHQRLQQRWAPRR